VWRYSLSRRSPVERRRRVDRVPFPSPPLSRSVQILGYLFQLIGNISLFGD
jgi:hypothetical protein